MRSTPFHVRLALRVGMGAACLLVPLASTVASRSGQSEPRSDQEVVRRFQVLDKAIHRLAAPGAEVRRVLRDADVELPGARDDRTRVGIQAFLARMPSERNGFICGEEFLRRQASKAMWRLRDGLADVALDPVEPAVCYASPFGIDATTVADVPVVDVYGIDLDTAPLQLVLVTRTGYQDVTSALVIRSPSHVVIRLGGFAISETSQSLDLAWGHLIRYSVPILHPRTQMCASRVETLPGDRSVSYQPFAANGIGNAATKATGVWADAVLDYADNKLEATLCVTIPEDRTDAKRIGGCTVAFLYTTDPDRVIDGIFGALDSLIATDGRRSFERGAIAGQSGPVRRWIFSGFGPGHEKVDVGVTARLKPVQLVSTEGRDCVAPIAYMETKRTTMLSAATKRALDAQTRSVDPAILGLRPRFAPSPAK
jgi:hypothetical protein